ncbi:MAG: hypothetical protein ACK41Z_07100 [Sediminibacterium sp.]
MKQRFKSLGSELSRDLLKLTFGGNIHEEGACTTKCSGLEWDSATSQYKQVSKTCLSFMGQCGCDTTLVQASTCQ